MGDRGPKAKPTHLKVLEGVKEYRINRDEPMPAEGTVLAPETLTAEAKAIWDYYAPDLIDKGVLTPWDVDTFAVYCETVAVYRDCRKKLGKNYTAQGAAGGVIKAPHWQIMRDCADIIKKYSAAFAFTPGDRADLRVDLKDNAPAGGAERILG